VSECLSCDELEQKICDLSEQISVASCDAQIWKEGDTTNDATFGLKAKIEVLKVYQSLYDRKNCGSRSELYEFVHVPCVKPQVCVGDDCVSVPIVRNQRRYRR